MKGKIFNNTTTTTSAKPEICSLEAISEGMKKLAMMRDTKQEDKILGILAAAIKFEQPENYSKLSDEHKTLIENAIKRAAYIVAEEQFKKLK
jgi:Ni,Fe-hydrogenase maturation factor